MCKQDVPVEEFVKNKFRKEGLQSRCKKCDCEYKASKYKEKREELILKAKHKREAKVQWMREYRQTQHCVKCGESRWYVLDFHHRDPNEKELSVAEMLMRGFGIERMMKEIDKCDVVCANCHREIHYLQRIGLLAETV